MPRPSRIFDPSSPKPCQTKRGQIELHLANRPIRKEPRVGVIFVDKPLGEVDPNLKGFLADRRADHRHDVFACRPKPHHRIDCRIEYAVQRPLPARMCRTDHARVLVRKQHWLAIGGQYGKGDPFSCSH